MTVGHQAIYLARNKTRRQYKGYAHEAVLGYAADLGRSVGLSRSEAIEAILWLVFRKIGKDLSFVSSCESLRIDKIRRAISHNK